MHVNARECVLNVLVEDPLETLALRVLLGRAPHLLGERADRLGTDGAVGRALGRVSRSLSSIHGLEVGERDTRAGNERDTSAGHFLQLPYGPTASGVRLDLPVKMSDDGRLELLRILESPCSAFRIMRNAHECIRTRMHHVMNATECIRMCLSPGMQRNALL